MSETRLSSILKTAAAGGAAGLGVGWLIFENDLDDFISTKTLKRTIISTTIAGVVFGAVFGALRPLNEEKKWSIREQDRLPSALTQR